MPPKRSKFGVVIGIAPGGVPAYSSHYRSADAGEYPTRGSYHSVLDGMYLGYKYQCVEFARRWLLLTHGVVFDDVRMAYQIFDLDSFLAVIIPQHQQHQGSRKGLQKRPIAVRKGSNGSRDGRPHPGTLLIWQSSGYFRHTGHVAVVTDVGEGYVRVAEQNVSDAPWGEGCDYARELPLVRDDDGNWHVLERYANSYVKGWIGHAMHVEQIESQIEGVKDKKAQQQQQQQRQPEQQAQGSGNSREDAIVL